MKKSERMKYLRNLIISRDIENQKQIVEAFLNDGISITQATVSRDVKEIGLIKVPDKNGKLHYSIPREEIIKIVHYIHDIKYHDKLITVTVEPGSGRFVKKYIKNHYCQNIFSLLADNDTILIIFFKAEEAKKIVDLLKSY